MEIKVYHTLHEDAVKIRKEVFMKEQGFHDEFDETDQTAFILSCTLTKSLLPHAVFIPDRCRGISDRPDCR